TWSLFLLICLDDVKILERGSRIEQDDPIITAEVSIRSQLPISCQGRGPFGCCEDALHSRPVLQSIHDLVVSYRKRHTATLAYNFKHQIITVSFRNPQS